MEFILRTAFSIEELLDDEKFEELEPLPEMIFKGTTFGLKMKLCKQLAPFILEEIDKAAKKAKKKHEESKDEGDVEA